MCELLMRAQAHAQHPQSSEECGHPTGAEQLCEPRCGHTSSPGRALRGGKKAPEGQLAWEFCFSTSLKLWCPAADEGSEMDTLGCPRMWRQE